MQPSELMAENVPRAFALLVESFCFLWRPQEARKNFLDHTEAAAPCGDVPKPVGVGIRQHFYHLRPQRQSSVLSIRAEGGSPRQVGRWHWHFLSKQHFVLKSHKNKFMEKTHASLLFTNVLTVSKI